MNNILMFVRFIYISCILSLHSYGKSSGLIYLQGSRKTSRNTSGDYVAASDAPQAELVTANMSRRCREICERAAKSCEQVAQEFNRLV